MNAITTKSTQPSRRLGVLLNYGTLIIMLAIYIALVGENINIPVMAIGIAALAIFIISFINLHVRTKLWKFVHTKIENLDEREIQVVFQSLRHSYSIFPIVCLSFFLVYELLKEFLPGGIDLPLMPIIAAFIYLAHTLPSSIIAWKEKEI